MNNPVKNFYEFTECINQVNNANNFFICSFDASSFYANVLVNETINIILSRLFTNDVTLYNGFTLLDFKKLLSIALNDTYIKLNGEIYKQREGLSMSSSLSPIIANIFLNEFETNCLSNCPTNIKLTLYKRS